MPSETYPWDSFRRRVEIDPQLCFILSPIRKEFAGTRQVIVDVASELGYHVLRADDIHRPGVIHADIWDHIQRAGAIVADITDLNPNVMFEVGVVAAIKEKFRLILIVRSDETSPIPFDLGPLRHIRYEDTLAGATELRIRLREYLKLALSEDNILFSISVRKEEWDRSEHDYSLLLSRKTLARLRGSSSLTTASPYILAYLLTSAVQEGVDVEWWANLNRDNIRAAEVLVELLLGPWVRPQFRAAYALQMLNDQLRNMAINEARKLSTSEGLHRLLDAVTAKRVVDFTVKEAGDMLNEGERHELIQNFSRRIRVRISEPLT
jgi:hypothetical protein